MASSSLSCSSDAHSNASLLTLLIQACPAGLALHKKHVRCECPSHYNYYYHYYYLLCHYYHCCCLQEHNTVVLPHKASRLQEVSYLIKVQIIKRFEFTSQAMMSGTVIVPEDAPHDTALLLVKGAPSVIKHMARPGSVPDNFDKVKNLSAVLWCDELQCALLRFAVLCCAAQRCALLSHAEVHVLECKLCACAMSSYIAFECVVHSALQGVYCILLSVHVWL